MPEIWRRRPSLAHLQDIHVGTMVGHIGIEFTEVGDDHLAARMPVDHRTIQPFRILHGGASVVLAETLGSCASTCVVEDGHICVGQSIDANHLRSATAGFVHGVTRPVHLGRSSHVWSIELRDDAGRLTCVSRLTIAVLAKRG